MRLARRELRRDRPSRRRHSLDRAGDARGERRRAGRAALHAPRRADRRRRDDGRNQVGLRPRNSQTERKSLRAARRLGERPADHGPHDAPRRACASAGISHGDREAYLDRWSDEMMPAIAGEGLADAVDAFCERIAFSVPEVARVFDAARRLGLPVKLHADQLSNRRRRGARGRVPRPLRRPSRIYRRSRRRSDGGRRRRRGPAAGRLLFLARAPGAPVALFRRHRVPMAVATDSNPGTSPLTSMLLALEHGGDAVRADGRRMPRGRHARCGAGARRSAPRPARSKPANGRIWRSGRSSGRPNSSIVWASIPCTPASGGADDRDALRPGEARLGDWRAIWRGASVALDSGLPGRRSRQAPRRSSASSPAASRSMASTPASASWPACGSTRPTSRRFSATSSCRMRPASARRRPSPSPG